MRQVGDGALWVGNAGDLRDVRQLYVVGIEAVVELADSELIAVLPRQLIRCRFPLSDGGDNSPWLLRLAAETVASFIRNKAPVLVCCSAGMNRSLCTAAAGLAIAASKPLTETLRAVCETGPVDISPRLLIQFQGILDNNANASSS